MTKTSLTAALLALWAASAIAQPGPSTDDRALEAFLREGRVVSVQDLGTGVTKPKKIEVEEDGERRKACFKSLDKAAKFRPRDRKVTPDHLRSDRYQYEVAAYRLDRRLGLGMVPVSVLREVDGESGAAIAWISGATDERKRLERGLLPADPVAFSYQQAIMRVFDALILNTDRHPGNLLYTGDGARTLHLIDHSRSFRLERELPETFAARPISLPRWLDAELRSLDRAELDHLLGDLIGSLRLDALMTRRDQLVAKVDRDLASYGADVVFHRDGHRPPAEAVAHRAAAPVAPLR